MLYVIPAKTSSTRVPDKNFRRDFHDGKSLVDIQIEKLLAAGADPGFIFLSCEDPDTAIPVCEHHGIQFLRRDASLCDNDVPLTTWMRTICGQAQTASKIWSGQHDIAWCQVCDPLFDEHREVLTHWEAIKGGGFDSLTVVHPVREYLLSPDKQPIGNWGFGEWHTPSQRLQSHYQMPFTLSVLKTTAIARTGYHVGSHPAWHISDPDRRHVDIDTWQDWELAQWLYARQQQARAEQVRA